MKKFLFFAACFVEGMSWTHVFTLSAFVYACSKHLLGFPIFLLFLVLFPVTFFFQVASSIRHAWIDTLCTRIEVQDDGQKTSYKLLSMFFGIPQISLVMLMLHRKLHIGLDLLFLSSLLATLASLKAVEESLRVRPRAS